MLACYTDKGCEVRSLATYMRMNYQYRRLDNNNLTGNSLNDFVRHQTVTEYWRKTDNAWKPVPNVYEEKWSQAAYCRTSFSLTLICPFFQHIKIRHCIV